MAARRSHSTSRPTSRPSVGRSQRVRQSTGMTRSFVTMVASAMLETITIAVAAESPPRNASTARRVGAALERQRQHERIRVVHGVQPRAEAREHDGHDQHGERDDVPREDEPCLADVGRVRALDEARRGTGAAGRKSPRRPAPSRPGNRPRTPTTRIPGGVCSSGGAPVEVQQCERADRRERQQLDDGFERDRQHHAFVMLGGVEAARAEQDREQCHQQRDLECRVVEPAGRASPRPVRASRLVPTALYCSERYGTAAVSAIMPPAPRAQDSCRSGRK